MSSALHTSSHYLSTSWALTANVLYRSIWRGYRDIKEAGGWVSLVFASSGVYCFCKYRIGFDKTFLSWVQQLQSSFEVAADTLHPEWRGLLEVINQDLQRLYSGHPHQWVTKIGEDAVPLRLTYPHLPGSFEFEFIEDSLIDQQAFGGVDPCWVPGIDSYMCEECGQYQSDNVQLNHCMCFPLLYGSLKSSPPVQIFQTANRKNNGVVARVVWQSPVLYLFSLWLMLSLTIPESRAWYCHWRISQVY